jgi:hypothetical protein
MAAYCIPAARFVLNLRARSRTHREYSQPGVRADQIVNDVTMQLDFAPRRTFDTTTQHFSFWAGEPVEYRTTRENDLEQHEHMELRPRSAQDVDIIGSSVVGH